MRRLSLSAILAALLALGMVAPVAADYHGDDDNDADDTEMVDDSDDQDHAATDDDARDIAPAAGTLREGGAGLAFLLIAMLSGTFVGAGLLIRRRALTA